MGAYGLQTHIWNNNLKSMMLLAGFPVLLLLLTYGLFLLYAGLSGAGEFVAAPVEARPFIWAADALGQAWPYALIAAGLWFGVAYAFHQIIIDAATGGRKVERTAEPRLFNLLENLCISRGLTTPDLRIIETPALNAFASGLHEGQYAVTVTRGLLEALTDAELEAVLAHELSHIRNRDVRLLVIAVVFVGIFSFVGEMTFRAMRFGTPSGAGGSSRSSSRDGGGGGGALIAVFVAFAIIAVSYALAVIIRFSLSRRREFLADAGAVELTKNPDALISALRKITGRADVPRAPADVREMFIENAHGGFGDLFATHPPIERRIDALVRFGGGVDGAVLTPAPLAFGRRASPPSL